MHEQLPRRLVARGEEQRRPVDAVEAEDVLRQEVRRRPEALEVLAGCVMERAQVVDERVGPDVGDLIGIPGDRHPPGLRRAADREIAQPALDEAAGLVVTEARQHELRVARRRCASSGVLVGGEAEEPVALLEPLGLGAVVGALAVDELLLGLERLAADAVQAAVDVLVDVVLSVLLDSREEVLDEPHVALIAGSDEEVVGRVDPPRHLLPGGDDLVGVLPGREPLLRRDARDLVRVLVHTRQEPGVVAALAVMPDDDVRGDGRVRVPDVRGRVHVVDRCGQVEAHHRK